MNFTPEVFEQEKKVNEEDLDQNRHVNNVRYVQWIQDIAKAHWEQRAGKDVLDKYFWVVIRHEIDYKNQAFLDDDLLLQTFVGKHTHVTSVRHVNILNKKDNSTIVKAKSTWCLMDYETKKPVKITEEMLRIFTR
ncbi:acyl-CoA thioesterase [Antarcticibacterium sp. 1MA-6-2]|uniref:acyl-CoA thioesterase n=1 Tax=Antarcticibacterium sp. 1MA-6-2 TaxID=2908210 RepID=UPI001F2FCB23|nr:acyl-CoA thioesterase [Antarcticibacterium sp. 1MA-6-2]UJH92292.1 acyl-CoA thioesterase [Antarcticibacterium sp. 1MA-6-2]